MRWKYVCTVSRGCESLKNEKSAAGTLAYCSLLGSIYFSANRTDPVNIYWSYTVIIQTMSVLRIYNYQFFFQNRKQYLDTQC